MTVCLVLLKKVVFRISKFFRKLTLLFSTLILFKYWLFYCAFLMREYLSNVILPKWRRWSRFITTNLHSHTVFLRVFGPREHWPLGIGTSTQHLEGTDTLTLWTRLIFPQTHCVRPIMPSTKDVQVYSLRICQCYLIWQKGVCRHDQIKDLKLGNYPGLFRYLWEKQEGQSQTRDVMKKYRSERDWMTLDYWFWGGRKGRIAKGQRQPYKNILSPRASRRAPLLTSGS